MTNLSKYSYVCEFEIQTEKDLNSEVISQLNSMKDEDSIEPGSFTLSECDYQRNTLRGRYYLKADIVAEDEAEYINNFKKDLTVLALKSQVEFLRIQPIYILILDKLTLMHSLESTKVYYNPDNEKFLVINSDRFCDGVYDSEKEAIESIERN